MKPSSLAQNLNRAAIFLGFIGIFITSTLTISHFQGLVPPCANGSGCSAVLTSPYSKIGPIPLALIGLLAYLAMTGLALQRSTIAGKPWSKNTMTGFAIAGLGVVGSAIYTFISLGVIREACLWCLGSAATMVGLFVVHALLQNMEAPEEASGLEIPIISVSALVAVGAMLYSVSMLEKQIELALEGVNVKGADRAKLLPKEVSRIKGNPNGKVVLIEFADPNCPSCRLSAEKIEGIVENHASKMAFAFRALPLPMPGHESSVNACIALEYADTVGKYTEAYKVLWDSANTERVKTNAGILLMMKDAGIDSAKLDLIFNEEKGPSATLRDKLITRMADDLTLARSFGISSTPTFVLYAEGTPPIPLTAKSLMTTLEKEPYRSLLAK